MTLAAAMPGLRVARRAIGPLLAGLAAAAATGQTAVRSDGRIFDANPSLTGGRINDTRLYSPLVGGNPYATGNVRFGQSLHISSPISDPTAFRAGLGSSTLSSFVRDSFSGFDASRAQLGGPITYYDPSATAVSSSFLRGQGSYGLTGLRDNSAYESRVGLRNDGGRGPLDTRLNTALNGNPSMAEAVSAANNALALGRNNDPSAPGGSIFGPRRSMPGSASFEPARPSPLDRGNPWSRGQPETPNPTYVPPRGSERLDLRQSPSPAAEALDTRLDALKRGDAATLLAEREKRTANRFAQPEKSTEAEPRDAGRLAERSGPNVVGAARGPRIERGPRPGGDVFTDIQLAVNYGENPNADWVREMLRGGGAVDTQRGAGAVETQRDQAQQAAQSEQFLSDLVRSPIRTFVGQDPTDFNEQMLKAESLLGIGQFYDAAARYQQAFALDPTNPLPLLGRGHAFLAAGDYASAAAELVRAFERYPELTKFQVDLRRLLGSGEMIDMRRSDIMKELERNDDARLHFLLGYIELNTGNRDAALRELDRAAGKGDAGSFLRRYPDLLRGTAVPPPPKLPDPAVEPRN